MTDSIVPERYAVLTTYTRCEQCSHVSVSSVFMSYSRANSRNRVGAPVRHWQECHRPQYNLPVDHTATQSTTPFCIRCKAVDLSYLPPPPSEAQLYDIAEPTPRITRKPATVVPRRPAPRKPTMEDLA